MHEAERDDAGIDQAEDLAAVQRMGDGDPAGLEVLYDRHAGKVLAVALRILQRQDDAEEVVADVFAQAWRLAARGERPQTPVSTWLLEIAHGRAVSRLRVREGRDVPEATLPAAPETTAAVLPIGLKGRVLAAAGVSTPEPVPARADVPARARAVPAASPTRSLPRWLPYVAAAVAAVLLLYALQLRGRVSVLEGQLAEATTRLAGSQADVRDARARLVRDQAGTSVLAAADTIEIPLTGQGPASGAAARAYWSRAHGLVLAATRLPDPQRGQAFQVWILNDAAPVSAGVFSPDGEGRAMVVFDTPVSLPQPTGITVSMEPQGGVSAPAGDVVLAGSLDPAAQARP